jgi:hypothetical protein
MVEDRADTRFMPADAVFTPALVTSRMAGSGGFATSSP